MKKDGDMEITVDKFQSIMMQLKKMEHNTTNQLENMMKKSIPDMIKEDFEKINLPELLKERRHTIATTVRNKENQIYLNDWTETLVKNLKGLQQEAHKDMNEIRKQ